MDGGWITVWDFRDAFPWYLAIGPVMVGGASLLFYVKLLGYDAWISDVCGAVRGWVARILGYPMTILIFVAGLVGTYLSASQYLNQHSAFADGDYTIAEGLAEVINPSPSSPEQRLEIDGEIFVYAVNNSGAFNFAGRFTEGGIVRTGMELRISHINGDILRIERRELPPTDTPH
ncbi:MAG: hypothetical protein DHS20C06_06260 [Hyphobacterium sp.]|nr:MAG: hypothetical protein DHS20C06_06260 [Hyphobacterium sp.]